MLSNMQRRDCESQVRSAIEAHQLNRLNLLLAEIVPQNHLYAAKLSGMPRELDSLEELATLPFTNKDELCYLLASLRWFPRT